MAFDPTRIKQVFENMHNGMSLRDAIGRDPTDVQMFFEYIEEYPAAALDYARAQRARAELFADEILEISDTEHDAQRARNRIDARKWYASKMQPLKYGDRIDLNVTQTVDLSAALLEARRRLIPIADQSGIEDAQLVELPKVLTHSVADDASVIEPETRDAIDTSSDDIFS